MTSIRAMQFLDTNGAVQSVLMENGTLTVRSYLEAMGEGDIAGHTPWTKIGYAPSLGTTEADIWSYQATQPVYVFPTAAMGMEVLSSNNTDDIGTSIFSGTSTGGTATSLIDTGKNFTAGTPVAVGDCVILDKSGTTPEFGYVTAVAATELTFANGFSSSGTGASRAYTVIDKSATAGAHAVKINYVDGAYATKSEIIVLNGTTVVPTANLDLFGVNSFRVIAAGANAKPTGNLTIRHLDNTPVYSYITAGYTRARNITYTVPTGKTLHITQIMAAFGITGNGKVEYARIYTRANIDPDSKMNTNDLFYAFTDMVSTNFTAIIPLDCPTKLPAKTRIRMCGIASATGIATVVLRGWLE